MMDTSALVATVFRPASYLSTASVNKVNASIRWHSTHAPISLRVRSPHRHHHTHTHTHTHTHYSNWQDTAQCTYNSFVYDFAASVYRTTLSADMCARTPLRMFAHTQHCKYSVLLDCRLSSPTAPIAC